jgi:hypothetical protein
VRWIALAVVLAACFPSEGDSAQNLGSDEPIEFKMAVIDAGPYGSYVRPDSPVVDECRQALSALESRCSDDTRTEIANRTISTDEQLTESGVFENLLDIMTSVADPGNFKSCKRLWMRPAKETAKPIGPHTTI